MNHLRDAIKSGYQDSGMTIEMQTCFLVTLIILNHLLPSFSTQQSLFEAFATVSFLLNLLRKPIR